MTAPLMKFCEPWIEAKLRDRLAKYKNRYPAFKIARVMQAVTGWDQASQRYAPYMSDAKIKEINRAYHKAQSIRSLAKNEHL